METATPRVTIIYAYVVFHSSMVKEADGKVKARDQGIALTKQA
ncbi:hypothetical protein SAMN05421857_1225 [Chryseobacterium formosense]|nr:hypothetical protein SAMN05421857_1225 [Chryseobacterium formosense]